MTIHGDWHWAELMSRDYASAAKFYEALFGWSFEYSEDMGYGYGFFHNDKRPVAGLLDVKGREDLDGIPSNWTPYIAVDDCDRAWAAGNSNGGTAYREPWDLPNVGRMAVIGDAGGGVLQLMTPSPSDHVPPPRAEQTEQGDWHWWELRTRRPDAAKKFYSAVSDWTFAPGPDPSMDYIMCEAGSGESKKTVAGIFDISPVPHMDQTPEHWMGFVAVADADATYAACTENGGRQVMPLMEMLGVGKFGVIQDPEGAMVGVIQPAAGVA